jgi:hypothetical protein
MSLDDFIITCFCMIEEMLPSVTQGKRVRERGPHPILSDSEVITIELVGSYLGENQDKTLFEYFRRSLVAVCTNVKKIAWIVLKESKHGRTNLSHHL